MGYGYFNSIRAVTNEEVINILWSIDFWKETGYFINFNYKITDRMLPWGTLISCGFESENMLFICVWKVWSSMKCFIKMESACRPRSFSLSYGHDVSGFFKVKKDCNQMVSLINASQIRVSIRDYLVYGTSFNSEAYLLVWEQIDIIPWIKESNPNPNPFESFARTVIGL